MGKDKRARAENTLTAIALANLTAALVDAMQDAEVPNGIVHGFLDELERLNTLTLGTGAAYSFMTFVTEALRSTVAYND